MVPKNTDKVLQQPTGHFLQQVAVSQLHDQHMARDLGFDTQQADDIGVLQLRNRAPAVKYAGDLRGPSCGRAFRLSLC